MNVITLNSHDGRAFPAYFSPASTSRAPGIVLMQEIWGVNNALRSTADRWAALGYNVIVPDLFWRNFPGIELDPANSSDYARGIQLMQNTGDGSALKDIESARQWLADHLGHDRIGGIGYCWGGRLAAAASIQTQLTCNVSYYGVGLDSLIPTLAPTAGPLLIHIAELDAYVPKHAREHILQMTAQRPNWQAFVYEGCDHAFARPASPRRNEAGAALAEERTLNFLGAYLG